MRVEAAQVAWFLADEVNFRQLMHFMVPSGATVGSFALAFHLSKLQAFRKVQKLLGLGLIVRLAEQRRRGKPVKLYHCPSRAFLIPNQVVTFHEILEEQHEAHLRSALGHALNELRLAGLLLAAGPEGKLQMIFVDEQSRPINPQEASAPALIWNSGELALDFEEAKALQTELTAVIGHYLERRGSGRYRYQLILTPDAGPRPGGPNLEDGRSTSS